MRPLVWLEAIDPCHRYGVMLWEYWKARYLSTRTLNLHRTLIRTQYGHGAPSSVRLDAFKSMPPWSVCLNCLSSCLHMQLGEPPVRGYTAYAR